MRHSRAPVRSAISVRGVPPPLIGRDDELRTLVDVVTHPPATVLIEGEAGIGKTRLVQEMLRRADPGQRWSAIAHCRPLGESSSYGPLAEMFAAHSESVLARLATGPRLSPAVGALGRLLPELSAALPEPPPMLGEPKAERHRTLRALRELLGALVPAVLVFEDVHWADHGTRELLRLLIQRPADGLAVAATYRPEDSDGLALKLARRHSGTATSAALTLGPLDRAQVGELARALLGVRTVSADFAAALHRRTAGIPFVVEETARTVSAEQGPAGAEAGLLRELPVPVVLSQAMSERMATLPATAVRAVEALAVLGTAAGHQLLSEVSGLSEEQTNTALLEALARGMLVEPEPNRYDFRHVLARQSVYDRLPGPRRRELHACSASALGRAASPDLVQVAEHHRRADAVGEWLATACQAAVQARDRGDPWLAADLYRRLLSGPAADGFRAGEIAVLLAKTAVEFIDSDDAITLLGDVLGDERLDRAARGTVRLHRGVLLRRKSGCVAQGRDELEIAVRELRDTEPAAAFHAMAVLAEAQYGDLPLAEHRTWIDRVDEQLPTISDSTLKTTVLANQLHTMVQIGDPAGRERTGALPERLPTADGRRQLTRGLLNLADACAWTGHYRQAGRHLRAGLARIERGDGTPFLLCVARSTEVHLDLLTGRWAGLADRAAQLLERYGDVPSVRAELSLVRGSLAVAEGNWSQARRWLREPARPDFANSCVPMSLAGSAALIRARLLCGQPRSAAQEIGKALASTRRKGVWSWAADLVPVAVGHYCRSGRREDAALLTAEFERGIDGLDTPLAATGLQVCQALLADCAGDAVLAAEGFARASARYAGLPAPYHAALAAEQAARCALRGGGSSGAAEMAAVAEQFQALGAAHDAERCAAALGASRQRRSGRPAYGTRLSPREREVAGLAAQGKTNRQIAELLFLSPRTVEHHVAKAMRKCGAGSRRDLRGPSGTPGAE
ncbi:AAA family ATPase [Amycolatopsis rubida]|uniref:AAA family ATPase n=1 Tax=Amycolatopsis rubida TaxID=112413 RepID=A0ABX0C6Q7_9PSEU|nr:MULTISPECIES: AAA family ATPase [Amycolatopsis]NEC62367.1 AAA family ATPase [Amycolatopsis rubida]OAP22786.1 Tetrathionate response regulatory protein TtrR [Amycolatopsis sp. M39]